MKKATLSILIGILSLSLISCKGENDIQSENTAANESEQNEAETSDDTTDPADNTTDSTANASPGSGETDTAEDSSDSAPDNTNTSTTTDNFDFGIFADSGVVFTYLGGTGGWSTEVKIAADGSFTGRYQDNDMGDVGTDYPNGTLYLCDFSGRFTAPKKVSGYVYSMNCEALSQEGTAGEEEIVDGTRQVIAEPYGFEQAGEFRIYAPGTPFDELPESVVQLTGERWDEDEVPALDFYTIYNVAADKAFAALTEANNSTETDSTESGSTEASSSDVNSAETGSHEITLNLSNLDEEIIYSETLAVEQGNLFDILNNIEDLKLVSEDSEGGKFIASMMDLAYGDGNYWNCYVNGEYLLENISQYEIQNHDVIDFRFGSRD